LAALPGVAARRARTLPAAALVLDRLLKRLAAERVVFSALGLREGLLYSQLSVAAEYLNTQVEGAQLISPAISLLTPAARSRAQILGRAILLAYRFSGVVPDVLASARLRIEPDCVR